MRQNEIGGMVKLWIKVIGITSWRLLLEHQFLKLWFLRLWFLKHGFLKLWFLKHGFLRLWFLKYGFLGYYDNGR